MNILDRINELKSKSNMNINQFEKETQIGRGSIFAWSSGRAKPSSEAIAKIADYFNVSTDYLLGRESRKTPTKSKAGAIRIPVLGQIPAGVPLEMIEDILDYEELNPSDFNPNKEYFGLKVKGNSMFPEYRENDILILEKASDCDSGDDVVVTIDGADATFKRLIKHHDGIILQPLNLTYEPASYSNKQIRELPITILGFVIESRRKRK